MGFQTVDIQYGSGFLNYINGYVSKCTDCLDFRLSEHIRSEENYKWRMVYRLLCQQSPCVPEIYAQFASLQLMRRTFYVDAVYAPLQKADMDLEQNVTLRLYGTYLKHGWPGAIVEQSFLTWSRFWAMRDGKVQPRCRKKTTAIGVRFCFELLDNYICQYCTMFFPHSTQHEFLVNGDTIKD